MEISTWVFLGLTVGLFLTRYVVKAKGVDFLTLIIGTLSISFVVLDPAVDSARTCLMYCIPQVFIVYVVISQLMFGKDRKTW